MNRSFFKEMEKIAIPIASALYGASSVFGLKDEIKKNKSAVQLESTKQQEEQLQLPGSNAYQFEGGKRIDSQSITAMNKY